jgi:hypothetical protein
MVSSVLPGRHWAPAIAAGAFVVALALPTIALGSDELTIDDDLQGTAPADTLEPGLSDAPRGEPVCGGVLLTFGPNTPSSAADAVSITTQTLDQDVGGWAHLGWEAASDRSVTWVTTTRGRETVLLPGDREGAASDVELITFCTETDPTSQDDHEPDSLLVRASMLPDTQTVDAPTADVRHADLPPEAAQPTHDVDTADELAVSTPASTDHDTGPPAEVPEPGSQLLGADEPGVAATVEVLPADAPTEVLGAILAGTEDDRGGIATAGAVGLLVGSLVLLVCHRLRGTGEVG